MLIQAGLREFGIPPWLAVAVVSLVVLLDVRIALATHQFILAEPVDSSFVLVTIALALGFLGFLFLLAPYMRIVPATSQVEDIVHALAGLDPRTSLTASFLRRARSLIVPCIILAGAAAVTPLDLSAALGVAALLFAATFASAATVVLLSDAAANIRMRALGSVGCISAAALAAWQAHASTGHLPLGTMPLICAILSAVLVVAATMRPRATTVTLQTRSVRRYGCRLPRLTGCFAPVALVLAQTRARPLSILPCLCVAAAASFLVHWACVNASSPGVADRIALIGACLPAAFAAVDAGSTTRHFSQSLWWLQAKDVTAAVRGTIIATSLAQFSLSAIIVATAALSGVSLTTALAALVLGTGVTVIARSIAALTRRRIRRSGVVGGSGLLELLEALSAAPFALLPVGILVIFLSGPASLLLSLLAPMVAAGAATALSRSVCTLGRNPA